MSTFEIPKFLAFHTVRDRSRNGLTKKDRIVHRKLDYLMIYHPLSCHSG